MKSYFNNKTILITGGTGSFGRFMARKLLTNYKMKKLIIFSRDEFKQNEMSYEFEKYRRILRFFIGDVRDLSRLKRAFNGVDIIFHAAALKQVPTLEYNPIEAIKTNILGAVNVIDAAIDCDVKKVVALSTDKAVNPVNLYGGTKFVSDRLFVSANAYSGAKKTSFTVVRYGNVAGSRGSITPLFKKILSSGIKKFPITDERMTRFWLSLDRACELVITATKSSFSGQIYVAKCPSFKIIDLAKAFDNKITFNKIGIRPGEKLHEIMVTSEDVPRTFEYKNYYIIYPQLILENNKKKHVEKGGKKVKAGFTYRSDENKEWLSEQDLKKIIKEI